MSSLNFQMGIFIRSDDERYAGYQPHKRVAFETQVYRAASRLGLPFRRRI